MRVLVFGGTGRLSKDVVSYLTKNEIEVYCLTRGSEWRKIFVDKNAIMLQADIRNSDEVRKLLSNIVFDVVIDFISWGPNNLENKLDILDFNFKQYIFISSATVYEPTDIVHTESNSILKNKWSYSANKILCEKYLNTLTEKFKKNNAYYTIVRPYVTYGDTRIPYPLAPRDITCEYSLVIRLLENKYIPVINLNNRVVITHAIDFACGVLGLLNNKQAENECYHITADETYKWEDVIDVCGKILKTDVKKKYFELDEIINKMPEYEDVLLCDKTNTWKFDNTKIKRTVTNFNCAIDLEKGLSQMLRYYQKYGNTQHRDYDYENIIQILCDYK